MKKRKIWFILAVILVIVIVFVAWQQKNKNKAPVYELGKVTRGNVTEEVDATGTVKPVQELGLSFQNGGKIAEVKVKVGDKVSKDQVLASTENTDLKLQYDQAEAAVVQADAGLASAKANLEAQQAKLDELKAGARAEDIAVSQTQVDNAKESLADAKAANDLTSSKVQSDLDQVYDSAISSASQAITGGTDALMALTDIQYAHFNTNDQDGYAVATAKGEAIKALFGVDGAGRWSSESISRAGGGTKGLVASAAISKSANDIDGAVTATMDALNKIKLALEAVPINNYLGADDKTSLNTQKNNVDSLIALVSSKQEMIKSQKAVNETTLNASGAKVNEAEDALKLAQDQLALKMLCASPEQIRAQQAVIDGASASIDAANAQIEQSEASAKNINSQLSKTYIISPIDGTVSKMDAKVGEIAAPGVELAAVISENQYEVEADVPEADVVKVAVGNKTTLQFDAIPDKEFSGKVTKIDPDQQFIGGVVYYVVTVDLDLPIETIKSGMSVDVTIITGSKENVLLIPDRAIVSSNLEKFVRIPDSKQYKEIKVEIGLISPEGDAEVLSGLTEGQEIITFVNEQ